MALVNSIVGAGILVDLSTSVQTWLSWGWDYSGGGSGVWSQFINYETTTEETREWVALTQTAAETAAAAAVQPTPLTPPDSIVASYDASEDQRTVGSYKLTKTTTTKINTRTVIP